MKTVCDLHFHTIASGHAYSTLDEYALEASKKNLELIALTDHAPSMPGTTHLFYFHNLKVLPQILHGVTIIKGAEVNIIDYNGKLDLSNEDMSALEYAIASLHLPCFKAGSISENTYAVIAAMHNERIDVIGHPDDSRLPLNYDEIVKAAAITGTVIEINNSSLLPTGFRKNCRENYLTLLKACEKRGAYIIVNSDAHVHTAIGSHKAAIDLLSEINFPQDLIINTSVEKLTKSLKNHLKQINCIKSSV